MPTVKLATAITTMNRGGPYLDGTILSYLNEGFTARPHVFAEPGTPVFMCVNSVDLHVHYGRQCNVGNWCYAAEAMLDLEKEFTHLLIMDDDIAWRLNANRSLFDGLLRYPDCLLNCWLSQVCTVDHQSDWPAILEPTGVRAIVLPREHIESIVAFVQPKKSCRFLHQHLNNWAADNGIVWRAHRPSLVEHTGEFVSTIEPIVWANAMGRKALL